MNLLFNVNQDCFEGQVPVAAHRYITINKELNAKASSGADIRYKSIAITRDVKRSGGGAVKKA